jgi:hypothetical protein
LDFVAKAMRIAERHSASNCFLLKPDRYKNPTIGSISEFALGNRIAAFDTWFFLVGRFIEVSINLTQTSLVAHGRQQRRYWSRPDQSNFEIPAPLSLGSTQLGKQY